MPEPQKVPSDNQPYTFQDVYDAYVDHLRVPLTTLRKLCSPIGEPELFGLELRAASTHLSRASRARDQLEDPERPSSASVEDLEKAIQGNLKSAIGHIHRCELDAYKWICVYYDLLIDEMIVQLGTLCWLSDVLGGSFIRDLRTHQETARQLYLTAKLTNSEGRPGAVDEYIVAKTAYEKLYELLTNPNRETKVAVVEQAKKKQRESREKAFRTIMATAELLAKPLLLGA